MTTHWYYAQNGKQSGPVTAEQLISRLSSGALSPSDLVWSEGLPTWAPAGEVPALTPPDASPPTLLRPYVPPPPPGALPAPAPQKLAPPPPPPGPSAAPPAPAPRMKAPAAAPPFASRQPASAPAFVPAQASPVAAPAPAPQVQAQAQAWDMMRPSAHGGTQGSGGEVAPGIVTILGSTKPWVRFLAVLGFLGLGMLVLGAVAILLIPEGPAGTVPFAARLAASFIYLLSGLLQLPAILSLNRYASRIAGLVASRNTADLEEALRAQNSFWRYVGILVLVMMILSALGTVAAIVIVGAGILTR